MELDRLLQLFRALHDHQVDYVLVGGVAMNLHGLVRGTDDLDLFILPSTENVERLRSALRLVWDDPEIAGIRAEDLAGDYATVRYGPPADDLVVDLISRLGSAFRYEDLESEVIELQGVPIRVATPATLYRMKRDTIRSDDRRDAQRLRERFDLEAE
jgi:hypothetical protein